MAEGDPIPNILPPMGAEFEKPYMEFEYQGRIHRMENLRGGHNGGAGNPNSAAIAACRASPPEWDEDRERWVVPIVNNLIDIDVGSQPEAVGTFDERSPLRRLSIVNNPRRSYRSIGYLISERAGRTDTPTFPVDCVFSMHIQVRIPGVWSLINSRPFALIARGLTEWPPPIGTVYIHEDAVEMRPEWVPFGNRFLRPTARILPGDETVITNVFEIADEVHPLRGIGPRLRWLLNRLT